MFSSKPYYRDVNLGSNTDLDVIKYITKRAHREFVLKAAGFLSCIFIGAFLIYLGILPAGSEIKIETTEFFNMELNNPYPGTIIIVVGLLFALFVPVNKYTQSNR